MRRDLFLIMPLAAVLWFGGSIESTATSLTYDQNGNMVLGDPESMPGYIPPLGEFNPVQQHEADEGNINAAPTTSTAMPPLVLDQPLPVEAPPPALQDKSAATSPTPALVLDNPLPTNGTLTPAVGTPIGASPPPPFQSSKASDNTPASPPQPVIAVPASSAPPPVPTAAASAPAPGDDTADNRVLLNADRVSYDSDIDTVTARGHVRLTQGSQVMTADVVSYNQDLDQITASGNVALRDETGNIFFGDYLQMKDKMSNGFIDQVKGILLGDAKVVGNTATRHDGRYVDMDNGVYSPCQLCKDDPSQPPIWQLRAREVEHDAEEEQLTYYDATLEMGGTPILWTPYFSNPDPTVKQRSGFLAPLAGYRSTLGAVERNYYYYGISPQEDATIEGTYASDQGPLLGGEYRNRFEDGKIVLSGSLAEGDNQYGATKNLLDPEKTVRGHVFGLGIYDLDDSWRTGFNIARTSDDTYLRTYGYSDQDVLDNRVYTEGFFDRNYAVVNIYDAQDLRPGTVGDQPLALPYANYQAFGQQGETLGGRWELNTGVLGITRPGAENTGTLGLTGTSTSSGTNSALIKTGDQNTGRTSLDAGWQRTIITGAFSNEVDGHFFGDVYTTNNHPNLPGSNVDIDTDGDFSGRYLPQVHDITSLPLISPTEDGHWLVQPMGSFTFAPAGLARNDKIPNEDSLDVELDTSNLFAANRFPGIDRIEDGAHVAYGVKTGYFLQSGGYATAIVGQSQRLSGQNIFPTGSGLDTAESDYVGGVEIYPGKYVSVGYNTRLDSHTLGSKLHQVNMTITPDSENAASNLGLNYLFLNSIPTVSSGQNRNSLSPYFSQKMTQYWTTSGGIVMRLGSAGRIQEINSTTTYQDDCLLFQVSGSRDLTNSAGGLAGTSIFFRVGLKTLGFFQSPNFAGALGSAFSHSSTTTQ